MESRPVTVSYCVHWLGDPPLSQYLSVQDLFQQLPGFNVGFVGHVRLKAEIQIHINRLVAGGL